MGKSLKQRVEEMEKAWKLYKTVSQRGFVCG